MRKGIASDRLGLSLSGPPMVDVRAEPDRDYADDTDLIYMRGGVDFRTRFTPADVVNVIAALSGAMPTAGEVVAGFLNERLEKARRDEKLAFGEIGPGPEVRALQRVIAMLEEK
jgi:hypothetical protein